MPWRIVPPPSWWMVDDVLMLKAHLPLSFCLDVPGQTSQHVPSFQMILNEGQWEHVQEGQQWMYGTGWSQTDGTGGVFGGMKCVGQRSRQ